MRRIISRNEISGKHPAETCPESIEAGQSSRLERRGTMAVLPVFQNRKGNPVHVGATYLYADPILADPASSCGPHCPWLGLFHVEIPAADASDFLAYPLDVLIPALLADLQH